MTSDTPLSTYRNFLQRRRSMRAKRSPFDQLRLRRDKAFDRSRAPAAPELSLIEAHSRKIGQHSFNVDERADAAILGHIGIKNTASALAPDLKKEEVACVREDWLKGKLGLTSADHELDLSIVELFSRLPSALRSSRLIFYYLLAERYGRLASLAS
jgi:hypothetical protein